MALFHKIKCIVSESLVVDSKQVIPEAKLVNDLGGDSLDLIELFLRAEDDFLIDIPDEKAMAVVTMQDLQDLVESY